MIKQNYNRLLTRGIPEKQVKYKKQECKHLTFEKKEKMYEYYICDNCGCEIKIKNKWERSEGGVISLPYSITKRPEISIAICNKCINPVLKEFEEED